MRGGRQIFLAGLLVAATGCARISTNKVRTASPDPARSRYVEAEKQVGAVGADAGGEDDAIEIKATRPVMCRDISVTPQIGRETTVRELQPPWTTGQWVLGIGGGGLGAAGAGFIVKAQHDDSSKKTQDVGTGAALVGLGAACVVAVLVNGIRAVDTTEEVSAEPAKTAGPWKHCGTRPADDVEVTVALADGTKLVGRTDATGAARLALGDMRPSTALLKSPEAKVIVGAKAVGTIDLSTMRIFAQWKATVERGDAEYQARLREARAAREKATQEELRQSALAKLAALEAADKQMTAVGPPWTPNKIDAAVKAEETYNRARPSLEELSTMTPAELDEIHRTVKHFEAARARVLPSLEKYADAAKQARERAMAAWEASPEGRRAAAVGECESGCSEAHTECGRTRATYQECDERRATCKALCRRP